MKDTQNDPLYQINKTHTKSADSNEHETEIRQSEEDVNNQRSVVCMGDDGSKRRHYIYFMIFTGVRPFLPILSIRTYDE